MKVSLWLFAAAALAIASVPALGVDTGRYVLKDVEGGFIRLDTQTGSVSHCRPHDGQWRCDSIADGPLAAQQELSALAEENASLRARVLELEAELEQRAPDSGGRVELPSDEDLDRIMGFFEKLMRRFRDFARSLQDDPGQKI